ncbi:hypothetical protein AAES_76465 [Amazona aestiva]|uniref:Uncharacterized protein n=1 Tax=Amazona aestiva TaxID=12930 RepID=A0A0Q3MHZ9_AMAAE|nr:hypothetical protein AAES_76465 [Amazona aestiva]
MILLFMHHKKKAKVGTRSSPANMQRQSHVGQEEMLMKLQRQKTGIKKEIIRNVKNNALSPAENGIPEEDLKRMKVKFGVLRSFADWYKARKRLKSVQYGEGGHSSFWEARRLILLVNRSKKGLACSCGLPSVEEDCDKVKLFADGIPGPGGGTGLGSDEADLAYKKTRDLCIGEDDLLKSGTIKDLVPIYKLD